MKIGSKGFTLIEILIVVAVIGILASVAIPAYQDSVKKGRRSDAQGALTAFANAMERHFSSNSTYLGAGTTGGNSGAPTIFPTEAPLDSGAKYYDLTIKAGVTATAYTLVATPKNAQTGDGALELDSTGARRWDRNNDGDFGDTNETCWETSC